MKLLNLHPYQVFTAYGSAFLVGIAFSSFYSFDFAASRYVLFATLTALLLVALINFAIRAKILTLITWSIIIFVLSLAFCSFCNQRFEKEIAHNNYTLKGVVVNNPNFSDKNQQLEIQTTVESSRQKILVFAPKYPSVKYGDLVLVEGFLELPKNFEGFNYQNYLKPKGIKYIIMKPDSVTVRGQKGSLGTKFMRSLFEATNIMTMSLKKVLPDPEAGLASGLVFGGKESLPESFTDNLKKTGLTHIVALSGYNVTIIFEIIALLMIVKIGRKRSFFVSLGILILFVLMTGASSSVLRASIFIALVQVSRLLGRKPDRLNVLLFTAIVMLLFNPFMLVYDMSFQLSFLAFIGLLYFSPWVEYMLFNKLKKIPDYLRLMVTQTLSAQLAVLPLLVASFGLVSIISTIANILILWVVPLAMGVSFLTSILSLIYLPLGRLSVVISWPVLTYIKSVVNLFASVPFASYTVTKLVSPAIILGYACIFAYVKWKKIKIMSYDYELEHGKLRP